VVRIDSDPPTVAFVGSPDPVQPELIEARVGDALSGPDTSRGEISVRAAGSGEPFRALSTEGRGGTLRARWPSEEYPEGEYEFQVMGYDMAGNRSATTERLNGSTMVLPSPLKARTRLVAVLGPKSTVPLGRSATVQGRLSASSDVSLSGRRIRVVERFGPGASLRSRTAVVETDHRGRFRLRLEPGPSREVRAAFAGTAATTGAVSPPLELGVRSRVGLRVSAPLARVGGRPVSFRGHVACSRAEISPDGVTVQLQFRAPGVEWTEFRTLRTDRRCRFHYSYRFSDDDSRGVRFRFRAVVPTQSDWPYEPGGSRPVAVRGA
jgi:hypothetical protein